MRYSRDKETIEESTSVNAGCRDVMTVQRLVERGGDGVCTEHPTSTFDATSGRSGKPNRACYALQEIEMV
jgi:hypothetical protein